MRSIQSGQEKVFVACVKLVSIKQVPSVPLFNRGTKNILTQACLMGKLPFTWSEH